MDGSSGHPSSSVAELHGRGARILAAQPPVRTDVNGIVAFVPGIAEPRYVMCRRPVQGCSIRREGAPEAAPEAARRAVGGWPGGWGRLLSVTNAIEAGTCRQGDGGRAQAGCLGRAGGQPPPPPPRALLEREGCDRGKFQSGCRAVTGEAVGGRLLAVGNAVGAGVGVWECLWGRVRAGVLGEGGTPPPPSSNSSPSPLTSNASPGPCSALLIHTGHACRRWRGW